MRWTSCTRLKLLQRLEHSSVDPAGVEIDIAELKTRFARAGYLSRREQRQLKLALVALVVGSVALIAASGVALLGVRSGLSLAFLSTLVLLLASTSYLRWRQLQFERQLLFHLPLVLEALVLAVDSGVSIFSAIAQLVHNPPTETRLDPVSRLLGLLYQQSSQGIPFEQAARTLANALPYRPLQHALIHLELSLQEGGELVPSLRGLSEHAHTVWRLSVEARVRRLENLVVYPVFLSVIGLMLLVAAVPIVPIYEFGQSMSDRDGRLPYMTDGRER